MLTAIWLDDLQATIMLDYGFLSKPGILILLNSTIGFEISIVIEDM